MDLGGAACGFDVGIGSGIDREGDVFADGAFVKRVFLADEGEVGAVGGWGEGSYGLRVEEDCAVRGVVEALKEGYCCGFAAALWMC